MSVRRAVADVVLVVTLIALTACSSGSSGSSGPLEGSFGRFDGSTTSFTAFRGKPVVMNFFSSTCIPCQSEMPALDKVHQTLGDQVTFLGMDVQDTVEGGKAFVATVGITWELGRDPDAAILQGMVRGTGLPTTVVLDRDGKIVFTHLGPLDVGGLTNVLRDKHLIN